MTRRTRGAPTHPNRTQCIHCGSWINPAYGKDAPAEHSGHAGTLTDPRAPGDYDNICDVCNYGKGLRGYATHHKEA